MPESRLDCDAPLASFDIDCCPSINGCGTTCCVTDGRAECIYSNMSVRVVPELSGAQRYICMCICICVYIYTHKVHQLCTHQMRPLKGRGRQRKRSCSGEYDLGGSRS